MRLILVLIQKQFLLKGYLVKKLIDFLLPNKGIAPANSFTHFSASAATNGWGGGAIVEGRYAVYRCQMTRC